MKDLHKLFIECTNELNKLNIPYRAVSNLKVNYKAKKRWGRCIIGKNSGITIEISSELLQDNIDDKATKTTIIHELLHTIKGCGNHGELWKMYANKVNKAYDYNIKRTTSNEEKGVEISPQDYKFVVTCNMCGHQYFKNRVSGVITSPQRYRCGMCKGDLTVTKM